MLVKFLTVITLVIGSLSVSRPCLAAPPKLEEVELAGKKLSGTSTLGANPSLPPVVAEEVSPLESEQVQKSLAISQMGMDHSNAPESQELAEIQEAESDSLEPTQDIVALTDHGTVKGRDIHVARSFRPLTVTGVVALINAWFVLGGLSHRCFGFPENHKIIFGAMALYQILFTAWVFALPHHFRD